MAGVIGGRRYFSPDYGISRERFRVLARARGAEQEALEIGVEGPDGTPLTIDMAWLGPRDATRVVAVSSGTHGIEGFMGSAAQLALLDQPLEIPDGVALVFLHAINPYGFANKRRVNEANVDQNRNFLQKGEAYSGAPEGYAELDQMLNPTKGPSRLSPVKFLATAAVKIASVGMGTLKGIVAGGQYEFPRGLFFGGQEPTNTMRVLSEAVPRWFGHAEHLLMIDYHTGLGAPATFKHLVDHAPNTERLAWLTDAFGSEVQPWDDGEGVAYAIRGGLGTWMKSMLPDCEVDVLAMEFGTVPALKVITALTMENRAHHHSSPDHVQTRVAKERMMDAFAPSDEGWRDAVVDKGQHAVRVALAVV